MLVRMVANGTPIATLLDEYPPRRHPHPRAGHAGRDRRRRSRPRERVLVTTDTDLGALLALSGAPVPSVLLLRGVGATVDERVDAITRSLTVVEHDLAGGAIVVVESDRVRIRTLPIAE